MNKYEDEILELSEKDKVVGQIYKMTNIITNKCYVGQTVSHRKNNNKYRPFGIMGRFKDHVSEAINNTKQGCTYLNNSIRKRGKGSFIVELLETCPVDLLDERETYYIQNLNTLYPNGYNLIESNHEFSKGYVKNNGEIQEFKKRGREFGYKHKKKLWKNQYLNISKTRELKI
jgi:group I intron endonuclease